MCKWNVYDVLITVDQLTADENDCLNLISKMEGADSSRKI